VILKISMGAGAIHSLLSISGLHKRLKILALQSLKAEGGTLVQL
jgi:hypothetical protein